MFSKDSSTPLWSYTTGGDAYTVDISADGAYITVASHDGNVYLFDRQSSTPLWNYSPGSGHTPGTVAISSDGQYIVSGFSYVVDSDPYCKIFIFNKDGDVLWNLSKSGRVFSVSISADGEYFVVGRGSGYFFQSSNSVSPTLYITQK